MTVFQGRKREYIYIYIYIRGKRGGPGDRIGFNLLWLEFQNTRWLMHIAFGSVPTSLCGRTSATTFPSPLPPPTPFLSPDLSLSPLLLSVPRLTDVNSFCHRINSRPHTQLTPLPLFSFPRVIRFKRYLCRVNRTRLLHVCIHGCHPTAGVPDARPNIESPLPGSRSCGTKSPPKWITCSRLLPLQTWREATDRWIVMACSNVRGSARRVSLDPD